MQVGLLGGEEKVVIVLSPVLFSSVLPRVGNPGAPAAVKQRAIHLNEVSSLASPELL